MPAIIPFELLQLKRPKSLIQVAQRCLIDYRRDVMLQRLLGITPDQRGATIMQKLLNYERSAEELRRTQSERYYVHHHIALLTAILHEIRNHI